MFRPSSSNSQRRDGSFEKEQRSPEQWRNQNETLAKAEMEEEEEEQPLEAVATGSCRSMCSGRELRERERQKRLHRFEMMPGTERDRLPRGDPLRAVKEYSRPAAGKDSTDPAELRPLDVLLQTVCYLIDDVAASPQLHPWTEASGTSFTSQLIRMPFD